MRLVNYYIICFALICCNINSIFASEAKTIIKIGTGDKNLVAYPVVSALCDIFNQHKKNQQVSCQVIPTMGSIDNLNKLLKGELDMGVMSANIQHDAYNGIGKFSGSPHQNLRALFGLNMEYFAILVKKDSGIKSFSDILGKRINIGNEGTGSRLFVDKLFRNLGWSEADFKIVYKKHARDLHKLFCSNQLDAALYLVGQPNHFFTEILRDCNTELVSLSRKEIEDYADIFRYVTYLPIKKGTYKGQDKDIDTLASQLVLVTSNKMSEKVVYDFVSTIFNNYPKAKNSVKALEQIDLFKSLSNVDSTPFHKGAIRYYKAIIATGQK